MQNSLSCTSSKSETLGQHLGGVCLQENNLEKLSFFIKKSDRKRSIKVTTVGLNSLIIVAGGGWGMGQNKFPS